MPKVDQALTWLFPTKENRLKAMGWVAALGVACVAFGFGPFEHGNRISFGVWAVAAAVLSRSFWIRSKDVEGSKKKIGLRIFVFYFAGITIDLLRNFREPVSPMVPAVVSLPLVVMLFFAICLLVWDLISSMAMTRVALDAAWITGCLLAVGWPTVIPLFIGIETGTVAERLNLTFAPVVLILVIGFMNTVIYEAGSRTPSGFVLMDLSIIAMVTTVTNVILESATGVPQKFFEGNSISWFISFAMFGVASQANFDAAPTQVQAPKARRVAWLTFVPLIAGTPIIIAGVQEEVRLWVVGAAILLGLLATRVIAIAGENSKLNYRLSELATSDFLTGVPNRRALDHYIATQSDQWSVTVLFIDLDHFKRVNDDFGHDAGDKVLKAVSQRLNDVIRTQDFIARLGGDEFVLALIGCTDHETRMIVQRIKQHVDGWHTFASGSAWIGTTIGICKSDGQMTPATLISKADEAMLDGKRMGKGSIREHTDEGSAEYRLSA